MGLTRVPLHVVEAANGRVFAGNLEQLPAAGAHHSVFGGDDGLAVLRAEHEVVVERRVDLERVGGAREVHHPSALGVRKPGHRLLLGEEEVAGLGEGRQKEVGHLAAQ